jgi:uncharacterized protein YdhG (YjbR/CyaY superfamily)
MPQTTPSSIDAYIAAFPPPVRARLERLRATIRAAAPGAVESISYQIPTFKLRGKPLIYFAGFTRHTSVYPVHEDDAAVVPELAPYLKGKGTAQFPHDKPLPLAVVRKVVRARVKAAKPQTRTK